MVIQERTNEPVFIGYIGENESREIPFFIGDIKKKYPDATYTVMHRRPTDAAAYPVSSDYYEISGNALVWTVQSGDLTAEGYGKFQIKAAKNGKIRKTKTWVTQIGEALEATADPPDPWSGWTEEIAEEAAALVSVNFIDDTAGEGDTDKTWSADKLTDELALKAPKASPTFTGTITGSETKTKLGKNLTDMGPNSTVVGIGNYNYGDVSAGGAFAEWTANTQYRYGDLVKISDPLSSYLGYWFCKTANSDASFTSSKWISITYDYRQHAFVVGNGADTSNITGSNALTVDWTGDVRAMGDVYTGASADGTGGSKLAKVSELPTVHNVPSGGSTGQVLAKNSGTDYDLEWVDQTGGGGTSDYDQLSNRPKIAGTTLTGNKSLSDLGIASASDCSAKYTKPGTGIPSSDMASAVQTSLGKADSAYQKPSGGIPAADIASGVIPNISGKLDKPSTAGTSGQVLTSDGNGGQSWQTPSQGTVDYTDLTNKPSINSVTLTGSKSLTDIGIYNVPSGGASGKILKKASATDYDLEWGDAPTATDAQVEEAVDGWLSENISNPSNPPLDRSLSSSSAAAPADMVGDLASDLNDVYIGKVISTTETANKLNPDEIETGKGLYQDGTVIDKSNRVVSGYVSLNTDKSSVVLSGLNAAGTARIGLPTARLCFYNSSKTFMSKSDDISSNTVTAIPENAAYARFEFTTEYNSQRSPMVEFVDSISGISATFVQYSVITERSHGINYLDEHQQELISDVEDLEDAMEELDGLADIVAADALNVNGLIGTEQTIDKIATFERGGINSTTGAYDNYYQYRVTTVDKFTADKTYNLSVASGFRIYIFYFTAEGAKISAEWHTEPTTIEKGSIVRMMVARTTEDTSETADVATFCSKAAFTWDINLQNLSDEVKNIDAVIPYGLTWDWWISANSVDKFGNAYIGYVDTDGYAGVLKRQPDGVMQYKRLEKSYNDDDHNGMATFVLSSGKILVIGAHGHGQDNHIICWRSKTEYSINDMEKLSFDITQGSTYSYWITYSQVFQYGSKLFNFCRCTVGASGVSSGTGYICLISSDNGSTWTAYQAIYSSDPYITFAQCTDDSKYLKLVHGINPSSGSSTFKGAVINLDNYKIYDLSNTEIGQMTALGTGTFDSTSCAKPADMTSLVAQTENSKKGRLFTVARTAKANTVFLYATATDSSDTDFTYKIYNAGTVVELGTSGTPFGNTHYISGACFGKDTGTVYYSKATTSAADGNHELHKVKISNNAVSSDEIITEASMCIIRPLFLGNGELATVVGHYNDQTQNGYNGSFTAWELKPMFTHA